MANRFWVLGSGTWDAVTTTNWSTTSGGAGGASAPTTSDAVIFDANSGTGTVSCPSGSPACGSFDASASSVLTLAVNALLNCAGSFTGGANLTINGSANIQLSPSSAANIKINGTNISSLFGFLIAPASGATTIGLLDDLIAGTNTTIEMDSGTLNTNNHNITCNIINYAASGTKTVNLGSSTITATNEYIYTGSNLTHNAGTSTVITPNYNNTLSYYNLTWQFTSNATLAATTASNNFIIQGGASTGLILSLSSDTLLSVGSFAITGNSQINRIFVKSSAAGTTRTLTATNSSLSNSDYQDITLSNSGSFTASHIGNCGRNAGIVFPGGVNYYWINPGGTPSFQSANWATSSGGTPGTNFPSPGVDTAIFDANSFTAGGGSINLSTFSGANLPAIDCTNITNNPTFNFNGTTSICGNIKFTGNMTLSGTNTATISTDATIALETGAGTWTATLIMAGINGILGFSGPFTSSINLNHQNGTLNRGSNNLQFTQFVSSTGSTRVHNGGSGLLTLTGTGSVWNIGNATGLTYNKGTGTIKFNNSAATTKTFAGAGLSYETIYVNTTNTGTFNVTGSNSFNRIIADPGRTIKFTAGTTTTVNFLPSGSSNGNVTITSVTAGAHTLSTNASFVSCDYLTLSFSTASQTNTFYAGTHSTNSGNNTNWVFQAAPAPANAQTFDSTISNSINIGNILCVNGI